MSMPTHFRIVTLLRLRTFHFVQWQQATESEGDQTHPANLRLADGQHGGEVCAWFCPQHFVIAYVVFW